MTLAAQALDGAAQEVDALPGEVAAHPHPGGDRVDLLGHPRAGPRCVGADGRHVVLRSRRLTATCSGADAVCLTGSRWCNTCHDATSVVTLFGEQPGRRAAGLSGR